MLCHKKVKFIARRSSGNVVTTTAERNCNRQIGSIWVRIVAMRAWVLTTSIQLLGA